MRSSQSVHQRASISFLLQSGPNNGINMANLLSGAESVAGDYGLMGDYGFEMMFPTPMVIKNVLMPTGLRVVTGSQWGDLASTQSHLSGLVGQWNARGVPYDPLGSNCNHLTARRANAQDRMWKAWGSRGNRLRRQAAGRCREA